MYTTTDEFGTTRIYPWRGSEGETKRNFTSAFVEIIPEPARGKVVRLGQWYLDAENARKLAEAICAAADMLEDSQ